MKPFRCAQDLFVVVAILLTLFVGYANAESLTPSKLEVLSRQSVDKKDIAELVVDIVDFDRSQGSGAGNSAAKESDLASLEERLPARIIVTDSKGNRVDGSGRGLYADGRFFVEGKFSVELSPGETRLQIQCGPQRMPLDEKVVLAVGERLSLKARMKKWFAPEKLGWFSGDNHVHTKHDPRATVKADSAYTVLQGRANGLAFITEADQEITAEVARQFDTPSFLYRAAPELRPGPFVGHFNTPGIATPLPDERFQQLIRTSLPRQSLHTAVRDLGAAMIHTHLMTPPHLLHWMGAAEVWSDAVTGRCADLLDIDTPASETLWYAVLNLGNRVGCSSYTDCALGRVQTPSPGDRRVYCKAKQLDYGLIVQAMRRGETVATNGGPLFLDWTLNGAGIGSTVSRQAAPGKLRFVCQSGMPLRTIQLFCGGRRVKAIDGKGQTGEIAIESTLDWSELPATWLVARAENLRGDWAVTSPIYLTETDGNASSKKDRDAEAMLLEISNHNRFTKLRHQYFAHCVVTIHPGDSITEVRLLRDEKVVRGFRASDSDQWHENHLPVTGGSGDYGPGWAWHKIEKSTCHFQADWPVSESGWYALELDTAKGKRSRSHAIEFRAEHPESQAISLAQMVGPGTSLTLKGYGESLPIAEIDANQSGDHWWYPRNTWWQLKAVLHDNVRELTGGGNGNAKEKFRSSEKDSSADPKAAK